MYCHTNVRIVSVYRSENNGYSVVHCIVCVWGGEKNCYYTCMVMKKISVIPFFYLVTVILFYQSMNGCYRFRISVHFLLNLPHTEEFIVNF